MGCMKDIKIVVNIAFRWILLFSLVVIIESANVRETCEAVKIAYGPGNVPRHKIEGSHLNICSQSRTCCTQDMEDELHTRARTEFDKTRADMIGLLQTTFISRTSKFDTFFTELLDNSRADLHKMFVRTYGALYEENSDVFMQLFDDLRAYYKGRDSNLLDVLDNFFANLLEKMFALLHPQYDFDDSYLECITSKIDELRPFGDVPNKMKLQVKRSFIAARTFVQGLSVGRDLVMEVGKIDMTRSCENAVTKMQYCSYCAGSPYIKPCNNYCMNVAKGCLAHYADLNAEWNVYLDALKELAERLGGPFNIEAVVDPIDVKISDAIMNFQESSETITQRVFSGCGQPTYRQKRAAASSYDDFAFGRNYNRKDYHVRPTTAAGTSLDRLVSDIEQKVSTTRDFFANMPGNVCQDMAMDLFEEDNCWNGNDVARYIPDVMMDGVVNQINNPEVEVDIRKSNFIVNQQLLQLKLITNKLRSAYNGVDVDWIDTADVIDNGSGMPGGHHGGSDDMSGSGSGSGDGGTDYGSQGGGGGGRGGDNRWHFSQTPGNPNSGGGYHNNPDSNVDIHFGNNNENENEEGSKDFAFDDASAASSLRHHFVLCSYSVTSSILVLLVTAFMTSVRHWIVL